jgi:ABC-type transport system involved in cytochrome bd biosynthesis fused ATPase/permease subunit
MKDKGTRGKGDAMFVWNKGMTMKGYPLHDEHIYKLTELAEIRARLFDGKLRTNLAIDNMVGRQEELVQMLGQDDVHVTFRKECL